MKGFFEGDDESGYSAYSPDLPGAVAAGATRQETEDLMVEAMAEHRKLTASPSLTPLPPEQPDGPLRGEQPPGRSMTDS